MQMFPVVFAFFHPINYLIVACMFVTLSTDGVVQRGQQKGSKLPPSERTLPLRQLR